MTTPETDVEAIPAGLSARWREAFGWIERQLGGRIVRASRQARWRPAWFLDLERGGETLPLYFRGDRSGAQQGAYPLEHEAEVLRVLERQGIPVPHVYAFCPEPRGILMERCRGRANLATARDDAERTAVLDHYMEILADIHTIELGEFSALGLQPPRGPQALGLADFPIWESGFRKTRRRPEPALEFVIGWIHRNVPTERERVSFVCADSGQFLFDEGRVTGVIDLELATFGDPLADLAGMLGRDLSEPLGDLSRAFRRYEALTGEPLDYDAIDFHAVRFCAVTPLALASTVAAPAPGTDLIQYLCWSLVWTRAALEIIGRRLGVEPGEIEIPEDRPTRHSPAHDALVGLLEPQGTEGFAAYECDVRYRIAEALRRADRMSPALEALDLEEAGALVGRRLHDWRDADEALEAHVLSVGGAHDAELARFFHRRVLRQEAILKPVMRELEGARTQPVERPQGNGGPR